MSVRMLFAFPGSEWISPEEIGGKGEGLIRLAIAGFPVPPGVVLGKVFFRTWHEHISTSLEWEALRMSPPELRQEMCLALIARAQELPFDAAQLQALGALPALLDPLDQTHACFAVRSSSIEEDREGDSFAGGFLTRLGVSLRDLHGAIRDCYVSGLQPQVFAYLEGRGKELRVPEMAVVVQRQVASEVAGVAFSLNPLTNDMDEVLVAANHGLGETVVGGEVEADEWCVERVTGRILWERVGTKQISRHWEPGKGLYERTLEASSAPSLDSKQIGEIRELLAAVEAHWRCPVDIEWAYGGGRLQILQARPITAFVPLPANLQTKPGVPRRLFMDIGLSSGLTINAPISTMGMDVFRKLMVEMVTVACGPGMATGDFAPGLVNMEGHRLYLDLSQVFWSTPPARFAGNLRSRDALTASLLDQPEMSQYRVCERPSWASWKGVLLAPKVLWRMRRMLMNMALPWIAPRAALRRAKRALQNLEVALQSDVDPCRSLESCWKEHVGRHMGPLMQDCLAMIAPAVLSVALLKALARPLIRPGEDLEDALDRGFEGNVVVGMGVAMHQLVLALPPGAEPELLVSSGAREAGRSDDALSFQRAWQSFVRDFGCRGPQEMDIASPRYADAPRLVWHQMGGVSDRRSRLDPGEASERQLFQRRAALQQVLERAGPLRRWALRHVAAIVEGFAGHRDTPKHLMLKMLHHLRQRLMAEGQSLVQLGVLTDGKRVFDFTFEELAGLSHTPDPGLLARAEARHRQRSALARQVPNFPVLIDSRGRIPQARRSEPEAGWLDGFGLSPGRAVGRARILRSAQETIPQRGEILIAYSTDPGWTPVFIHAAAVVLEIGGVLQHGALVARELGLPCVAGIPGLCHVVQDGQWLEVDGNLGRIRVLESVPPDTEREA